MSHNLFAVMPAEIAVRDAIVKGLRVMWNPEPSIAREVVRVAENRAEDEPGLCAFFSNGEYVDLCGCEPSDFITYNRLTP